MNSLKNVHFFRKVPTDITEATAHGGFISIAGAVLMVVLFLTELSAYMTVEKSMQVKDPSGRLLSDSVSIDRF